MNICNIAKMQIITIEEVPRTLDIETAEEVTAVPRLSKGEEVISRVKNRILAITDTEDLIIGYDIKAKDNSVTFETMEIFEGGTLIKTGEDVTGYEAPVSGSAINRMSFDLIVYAEEKEGKDVVGYVKFTFPSAKGTPIGYAVKDKGFVVNELTFKSTAAKDKGPVKIEKVTELPV